MCAPPSPKTYTFAMSLYWPGPHGLHIPEGASVALTSQNEPGSQLGTELHADSAGVGDGVGDAVGEAVGDGVGDGVGDAVGDGVGATTQLVWPVWPLVYSTSAQGMHDICPERFWYVLTGHTVQAVSLFIQAGSELRYLPTAHGTHASCAGRS